MMAEVRFCAHLCEICTLLASTAQVQLCASFGLEVLLETHLRAFDTTKLVVFCKSKHVRESFRRCASTTPPCDLHITCECFCASEVRRDSGLYNTK